MKRVLIINGPNLNMLGKRPKEHYGSLTLEEINNEIIKENNGYFNLEFYQSNSEGNIVTKIQEATERGFDGIIINPAAYTHTSVAIRDALEIFTGKKVEVHLSDVDNRDDFRKVNFVRDVCDVCFSKDHDGSYLKAINYLKNNL